MQYIIICRYVSVLKENKYSILFYSILFYTKGFSEDWKERECGVLYDMYMYIVEDLTQESSPLS